MNIIQIITSIQITSSAAIIVLVSIFFGYWFLVLLITLMCQCSCFAITQNEAAVVEKFGKYQKVLTPGWYCLQPFLQKKVEIKNRYVKVVKDPRTGYENLVQVSESSSRINKAIITVDYPSFEVFTYDNCKCNLDLVLSYKVIDCYKYAYSAQNIIYIIEKILNGLVRQRSAMLMLDEIIQTPTLIETISVELQNQLINYGLQLQLLKVQKTEASHTLKGILQQSQEAIVANQVEMKKTQADKNTRIINANTNKQQLLQNAEGEASVQLAQANGQADIILQQSTTLQQRIKKTGISPELILKEKQCDTLAQAVNNNGEVTEIIGKNDKIIDIISKLKIVDNL